MNNLLRFVHPFRNMNEACIALLIKSKYADNKSCAAILTTYLNIKVDVDLLKTFYSRVSLMPEWFPVDLISNIEQRIQEIEKSSPEAHIFYIPKQYKKNCCECNGILQNVAVSTQARAYFFSKPSRPCILNTLKCKCGTSHFLSYYVKQNGAKVFYNDVCEQEYITFSNETVFQVLILKQLTLDIVYKHASFKNYCASYNALFSQDLCHENRAKLIDKRLTEGWFYYQYLIFKTKTNNVPNIQCDPDIQNLDSTIRTMRNHLFHHFVESWSNHKCDHELCSKALNIDGNHKVNRLTCCYDNVFLKTNEIESNTPIVCPRSPQRNSYFCEEHLESIAIFSFDVNGKSVNYNVDEIFSYIDTKLLSNDIKIHDCFVDKDDSLLYLVTSNKKLFWCAESYLPRSLLNKFIIEYSQTIDFTKNNCTINKEIQIPCKKKCRTTGVLLSVFNCGIINGYREIFVSESLAQVSIFLIDLIKHSHELPKFLIYDNACHLHSYLQKPRIHQSPHCERIKGLEFVIDRFHIANHSRGTCRRYYNADNHDELKRTNTVVCEEVNYWFSAFKHNMKHMNADRFVFFLYIIATTYNQEKIKFNAERF